VEDDPVQSIDGAAILEENGFRCVTAGDGEHALETFESDPDIDLVLVDIDLGGGLDGTDVARLILERRHVPVVFLTAHSEEQYVEKAKDIVNYGYVLKGSGESVLLESVSMALKLYDMHRRLREENERRKAAEEELAAIYDQTPSLVVLLDGDYRIRKANRVALRFTGKSAEEVMGKRVGEALGCFDPQGRSTGLKLCESEDYCRIRRAVLATFQRERGLKHVEARLYFHDTDSPRDFIVSTSFLRLGDGPRVIASAEDITGLKQMQEKLQAALEQKDHLMDELNHRVKNNLSMISSLVRLKDSDLGNRADLSDIHHQINAIATAHEKLQHSRKVTHIAMHDYVGDLLSTVFSISRSGPVTVENNVQDIEVRTPTALSMGLIINELATNAMKHGFTDRGDARFAVALEHDADAGDYRLTVSNTGRAFPKEIDLDAPTSLGLRLVVASVKQRRGSIDLTREPSPTFTIRIPVDE
jgi:two-component sensor histidine kinase/DNA-binding NarL/FixJ family response regulator